MKIIQLRKLENSEATSSKIQNFTLDWSISEDASEITPARASSANPAKYTIRISCQLR